MNCRFFVYQAYVYMKLFSVKAVTASLIIAVILFYASSCAWDKTFLFGNGGDGVKDTVCYQSEIEPIINSNCAMSGCHDATSQAAGYDLSNYFGVMNIVKPRQPSKSTLIKVTTGGGEEMMPPSSPPLTSDQIDLITTWIEQGAGYNIDCGISTPCDTANVTYSGTVQPIIQNNCLGCHSSYGTGGGILLNTYSEVADQALSGNLLCAVYGEPGCNLMPKNSSPLSSCDLTKLTMWVDAGAPNNWGLISCGCIDRLIHQSQ